MNKAEQLAEIVTSEKGNIMDHIRYFFMLRRFRTAAKNGYTGVNWYGTLHPWLLKKFETDGLYVTENLKNKDGNDYISIEWIPEDLSKENEAKN